MRVFAEFAGAEDAARALQALRARGYRRIETYAPFPLTGEDAHAPSGSFPLAFVGFMGGAVALAAAYGLQWYANAASYPLDIGGRPAHAVLAFVPATFESICLFAVIALFTGFLLLERLPRLWQPIFEIEGFERATVDRFWIVLEFRTPLVLAEKVATEVHEMNPLRVIVQDGAI